MVEEAKAMPLSASCIMNRAQVLDLIDDIRSPPAGVAGACDQVLADRDSVVDRGQRDAEHLLDQARAEQAGWCREHEVYLAAVAEADHLRVETEDDVARMRREVDDYVDAKLANFEVALHKTSRRSSGAGRRSVAGRPTTSSATARSRLPG